MHKRRLTNSLARIKSASILIHSVRRDSLVKTQLMIKTLEKYNQQIKVNAFRKILSHALVTAPIIKEISDPHEGEVKKMNEIYLLRSGVKSLQTNNAHTSSAKIMNKNNKSPIDITI